MAFSSLGLGCHRSGLGVRTWDLELFFFFAGVGVVATCNKLSESNDYQKGFYKGSLEGFKKVL